MVPPALLLHKSGDGEGRGEGEKAMSPLHFFKCFSTLNGPLYSRKRENYTLEAYFGSRQH